MASTLLSVSCGGVCGFSQPISKQTVIFQVRMTLEKSDTLRDCEIFQIKSTLESLDMKISHNKVIKMKLSLSIGCISPLSNRLTFMTFEARNRAIFNRADWALVL
eukprot:TRINITY_DN2754_c0_g1_i1.p1 TRINITY_DN2754_c0_g1~~TRINITY_DN2754_c0_g1_i1.p1  ORF type:complete len:105 (-),score=3.38 TRINITY_DN2754_c0_g1_i1:130-444(-)